jgi:N-methylhydantoinase B
LTEVTFTGAFGRCVFLPWAVDGWKEGSPNSAEFVKSDGSVEWAGNTARYRVAPGELIRLITATGGGWGDPLGRLAAEVVDDLREG